MALNNNSIYLLFKFSFLFLSCPFFFSKLVNKKVGLEFSYKIKSMDVDILNEHFNDVQKNQSNLGARFMC